MSSTSSHDFSHLQERYKRLLQRLGHKPRYMFQHEIHTHRLDEGSPHVEWVDGHYEYVVTERGRELQRRRAPDEDELLYWMISDVTAAIASHQARRGFWGRDPRRKWFARDVELLTRLDPVWGERKKAEYNVLLRRYPFRDRGIFGN
jgi:hypothetical protein